MDVGFAVCKEELAKALAYDRGQYEKGWNDCYKEFAREWIPVDERLPKDLEHVLVCLGQGNVLVGYYTKDFMWYTQYGAFVFNDVVAWMPLPNPYKPKGE